jgi:hypothetical protein
MSQDKIDYSIDLGDYDTTSYALSSSGIDTITLDPNTFSSITSSTISVSPNYNWSGTNGTGIYTTTGTSPYIISNGGGYSINTTTPSIQVKGDAEFDGDIKMQGKSLNAWMEIMEQRLAILVPDPKKLEKFEALKKAYEHYKTMESLCFEEEVKESK